MKIKNLNNHLVPVLLVSSILIITTRCKHDPDSTPDPLPPEPEVCDTLNVTYKGSVVPVLSNNCYACHSGSTINGGVDLSNYETVSFLAESGKLAGVINQAPGFTAMPPTGKLKNCEIRQIEIWIRDTTFTSPPEEGHPCDPDTVYFQNDILPLIKSSCSTTDCHDALTDEQDVLLVDYASIIEYGDVTPGNPEESKMYRKITDDDPDDRMPPPPKESLTAEQIEMIRVWIAQGAKNNRCDEDCDTTDVTYSGTIWPLIQNNCFGCHSGPQPSGDVVLTDHASIAAMANTGRLFGAISHSEGYEPMPRNGAKLSDCKIEQVKIWIDNGTPDN